MTQLGDAGATTYEDLDEPEPLPWVRAVERDDARAVRVLLECGAFKVMDRWTYTGVRPLLALSAAG
jgi:hypothetical protein